MLSEQKIADRKIQNRRSNIVLSAVALFFVFAASVAFFGVTPRPSTRPAVHSSTRAVATVTPRAIPNQVTMQGFPGNGSVQMFDTLATDAKVMAEFPDGTICAKLSGPTEVNEYGVKMSFYKVACGMSTGYVNVRWAKP